MRVGDRAVLEQNRAALEELRARVDELTKELNLREEALKATKERAKLVEDRVLASASHVVTEKVSTVAKAKLQEITEYKASREFEVEVAKGSVMAYGCDFEACRIQMKRLCPDVNIGLLDLKVSEHEVEVEASYAAAMAKQLWHSALKIPSLRQPA